MDKIAYKAGALIGKFVKGLVNAIREDYKRPSIQEIHWYPDYYGIENETQYLLPVKHIRRPMTCDEMIAAYENN